jgi:hypothetical protein
VKAKDSLKFKCLFLSQLASGVLSTLLAVFGFYSSAAYACSIFYGISLSLIYPLLLSVSSEFDIHFEGKQISNMMISTTISSGVFATLSGLLMKGDINMLFYSLLAFSILLFYTGKLILESLRNESLPL